MLKHSAGRWGFASEQTLEGFLAEHLQELGLTLLQRQYVAVEDRSDLLAVDESGALVILELKNVEDSGIVAQLTRYYSTVIQERPHSERVDYSLPVRLIAIAPGFRRQNFVDRKYSRLEFVFLLHSIEEHATGLTLRLIDLDGGQADVLILVEGEYALPNPATEISNRILKGIVSRCGAPEREGLLWLRRKLLGVPLMEESTATGKVLYGRGQRFCAEVRIDVDTSRPLLFLWLPEVFVKRHSGNDGRSVEYRPTRGLPFHLVKKSACRMLVETDWRNVSDVVYMERGTKMLGRRTRGSHWSAEQDEIGDIWQAGSYGWGPLWLYLKHCGLEGEPTDDLEPLVNLAIANWMSALPKGKQLGDARNV